MFSLLKIIRWQQLFKNVFIFVPLFFGGRMFDSVFLVRTCWVFLGFCLVSLSVYLFNDWLDRSHDRVHPRKKKTARIARFVSRGNFLWTGVVFLIAGLEVSTLIGPEVVGVVLAYCALQIFYNAFFKKMVYLDVICIAAGFELRIILGSIAALVQPSFWLMSCVFFLAMFIALAKRKSELHLLAERAGEYKRVLKFYTHKGLNYALIIVGTIVSAYYLLYLKSIMEKFSNKNPEIACLVLFSLAVFGLFRYVQTGSKYHLDSPLLIIVKDKLLALSVFCWILGHYFFQYMS